MQSVSSMIWTRVTVAISYDDNDYTTGTPDSLFIAVHAFASCVPMSVSVGETQLPK